MACGLTPAQFCPNYQNCQSNVMNFMYVLCYYYYVVTQTPNLVISILANAPIEFIYLPALAVSLMLYILYILSFASSPLFSYLIPSIVPILASIIFAFLTGAESGTALERVFKWR